ncbi:hypothetical protein CAPTEDRAFT_191424 [Capitella teleta]|uniref:Uncharacterized protein n=1 Tax=Capitella teleta TaxID=283909 RepID=R7V6J8_CAPTE|nr:hypothetical protein CAPTEDRAFT_191424 [Capitella teleta]|eukprot:ELU14087.1 hypothetical protein CAPTEDRAFT_191424 [Capitella teleta]
MSTQSSVDKVEEEDVLQELDETINCLKGRVEQNKEELLPPLKNFIAKIKSCATDSALSSALQCFGRYTGLKTRKRLANQGNILVQPTAIARRKTLFGGRRVIHLGRPLKGVNLKRESAVIRQNSRTLSRKKASTVSPSLPQPTYDSKNRVLGHPSLQSRMAICKTWPDTVASLISTMFRRWYPSMNIRFNFLLKFAGLLSSWWRCSGQSIR